MFVYILGALLLFISVMMILLILIQRGRGGGLAGAFGGMGGQSALGVRAGDVFTKITVVVAVSWVLLAGVLGISMRSAANAELTGEGIQGEELFAPEDPAAGDEAGEGGEAPAVKKADDADEALVPEEADGDAEAEAEAEAAGGTDGASGANAEPEKPDSTTDEPAASESAEEGAGEDSN